MKLNIEHIAPYLPYSVKVGDGRTPFALTADNFSNVFPYITEIYLHPLSNLTKEIEVNGEKFVPIDWFNENYAAIQYTKEQMQNHFISFGTKMSYDICQKLFEWHFDLFELIEKDLAIDINTL